MMYKYVHSIESCCRVCVHIHTYHSTSSPPPVCLPACSFLLFLCCFVVQIFLSGTSIYSQRFDHSGIYSIFLPSPVLPQHALLSIYMKNDWGQIYTDSYAVAFNIHFYRILKVMYIYTHICLLVCLMCSVYVCVVSRSYVFVQVVFFLSRCCFSLLFDFASSSLSPFFSALFLLYFFYLYVVYDDQWLLLLPFLGIFILFYGVKHLQHPSVHVS